MPDVPAAEEKKDYSVRIINPNNQDNPFQREVRLGKDLKAKIETDFGSLYKEWESNTSLLKSRLQRSLNLSEGIYEQPKDPALDFPWANSSKICKPITETRINIIHSFFMSVIRPRVGRLFQCVTDKKHEVEKAEKCRRITSYFNNNRKFNLMYVQKISEAFWAVLRDGTIGRTATWNKKTRRKWKCMTYKALDEFMKDYPDPLSAFSGEELDRILKSLNEGQAVKIDVDYDEVVADDVDVDFALLKDCVWVPVNATCQDQTIFIGYRGTMRKSEIIAKAKKDGVFSDVGWVETVKPTNEEDAVTVLERQIEGLTQGESKTLYTYVHGRLYWDLDGDGIDEIYLVTYFIEPQKFVQFDRYPFYHGNDFLKFAGFKKRPKRLLYRSVPDMVGDLNEEANISARQRIDSRAITNSPMFKMIDTLKMRLDPRRPENRFRPGGVWYLNAQEYDKVSQIDVAKKDFGESTAEEANLERAADNVMGASELRSGRETPADPRAPAAKTAMLLTQSSVRLDDFIFDFVLRENETLDDVLQLVAQFGPDVLETYMEAEQQAESPADPAQPSLPGIPAAPEPAPMPAQGEVVKIKREDLVDKDIHLQLSFTSLLDNPEYLRGVWERFHSMYSAEPFLEGIPEVRHLVLKQITDNMPEAQGLPLLRPLPWILQHMPQPTPGAPGMPGAPGNPGVNPTLLEATTSKPGGSTL